MVEALFRFAGEEEAIGAETVTQIVAGGASFGGIRFGAARFGTVGAGGYLLGFCAFEWHRCWVSGWLTATLLLGGWGGLEVEEWEVDF